MGETALRLSALTASVWLTAGSDLDEIHWNCQLWSSADGEEIVKAERIRTKAANWSRLLEVPRAAAAIADSIARPESRRPPICGLRPAARCALSFCFAGQAIGSDARCGRLTAHFPVQPADIRVRVLPTDADHRVSIRLTKCRLLPVASDVMDDVRRI
jgi:hypothetical protein